MPKLRILSIAVLTGSHRAGSARICITRPGVPLPIITKLLDANSSFRWESPGRLTDIVWWRENWWDRCKRRLWSRDVNPLGIYVSVETNVRMSVIAEAHCSDDFDRDIWASYSLPVVLRASSRYAACPRERCE